MSAWKKIRVMWLWVALGCGGASSDPGLRARLWVEDAEFVPGPLPREDGGPAVLAANLAHNEIEPGLRSERLRGTLEARANALLIGLAEDFGYWIVEAKPPTVETPGLPSYTATLSFADTLGAESSRLILHAVGRGGRVGPARELPLHGTQATDSMPLRVQLTWDSAADLDLHVVDPQGHEIWAGNVNSYEAPAPGELVSDPLAVQAGGRLDMDANADCRTDGPREENVVWAVPPPSGRYTVRVAAASLCRAAVAHYGVEAWLDGESLARASGIAVPEDTRSGSERGDGSFALEFRVP